jgi:hypothetical protein
MSETTTTGNPARRGAGCGAWATGFVVGGLMFGLCWYASSAHQAHLYAEPARLAVAVEGFVAERHAPDVEEFARSQGLELTPWEGRIADTGGLIGNWHAPEGAGGTRESASYMLSERILWLSLPCLLVEWDASSSYLSWADGTELGGDWSTLALIELGLVAVLPVLVAWMAFSAVRRGKRKA